MTLHLIQPRELYGPAERRAELQQVWDINDALFDTVTAIDGRPTFAEMFALCRAGTVNVIANSDVYFDHTLRDHLHHLTLDEVWALSRWDDYGGDNIYPYHRADSQDAWVVLDGPHDVDAPYTMGQPGCDNAIAHELSRRGWQVTNPCQAVRAMHLHCEPAGTQR